MTITTEGRSDGPSRILISLPRRPTQIVLGVLLGIASIWTALVLAFDRTPAPPMLLKGLRAGSYLPCPLPPNHPRARDVDPGAQPVSELTVRLRQQFRAGTPSSRVEPYLRSQRFAPSTACHGHPDHRVAVYREGGRWAGVAWEVAADGTLADIQGSIQFDGF